MPPNAAALPPSVPGGGYVPGYTAPTPQYGVPQQFAYPQQYGFPQQYVQTDAGMGYAQLQGLVGQLTQLTQVLTQLVATMVSRAGAQQQPSQIPTGFPPAQLPQQNVPSIFDERPPSLPPVAAPRPGQQSQSPSPTRPHRTVPVPAPTPHTPTPPAAPPKAPTAGTPPTGRAPLGRLTPDVFNEPNGLSDAERQGACGPAAAVAFTRYVGLPTDVRQALDTARDNGWWSGGMHGPDSQVQLLQKLGVNVRKEDGVDWEKVKAEVRAGRPVIIDTERHYWVVEGYNEQTGEFNFAESATPRQFNGDQTLTVEQMAAYSAPRSAIFLA